MLKTTNVNTKNGLKIIKGIFGFIEYWKELYEKDITKHVKDNYEPLITYWDCICSALMTLGGDTSMTLRQGFWPHNRLIVVKSDTMFFDNGDVRKEFAMDEHYIGPVHNWLVLSFRVGVDWHDGCMVLIQAKDEGTLSQFGWWKHCYHSILFELTPIFVKLKWNITVLAPKIKMFSAPIQVGIPKKVSSEQWTQCTYWLG